MPDGGDPYVGILSDPACGATVSEKVETGEGEGIQPPGGFEIICEIGRGGQGVVYRARDLTLGVEIAIKVPRHANAQRFLLEAQTVARLQHPGIIPLHLVGTFPDGRPFMAMKIIHGMTLDQMLLNRDDPSHRQIDLLRLFGSVCQTMAFAHSQGVIHRSLKPSAVMVGAFGEVYVISWGLTKNLLSDIADSYKLGPPIGTPAYMPPEQARGEYKRMDPRSDVFGLGGILCEILTGQPPFPGKSIPQVIETAATGDLSGAFFRLDQSVADSVLIALCKRCLAPNPDVRFADGGDVAFALSAYVSGLEGQSQQNATVASTTTNLHQPHRGLLGRLWVQIATVIEMVRQRWTRAKPPPPGE